MPIEKRIFIESKAVVLAGVDTGYRHLYLVMRDVNVSPDGTYQNVASTSDLAIRGGPSGLYLGSTSAPLKDTLDAYGPSESPHSRQSVDITSLVLSGKFSSVSAAWAGMSEYATGINSAQYNYNLPFSSSQYVANSNAVVFSVLSYAGVDARSIGNSYFGGYYINSEFPGAASEFGSTLLRSGVSGELVASDKLTSGVSLLGGSSSDDIMRGTKYSDKYFGGQNPSGNGYDTVTFDHLSNGLTVTLKKDTDSPLQALPNSVMIAATDQNSSHANGDLLYDIDVVKLTNEIDHIYIEKNLFNTKIQIDLLNSHWGSDFI